MSVRLTLMSRGDGHLMRYLDEVLTAEPQTLDELTDKIRAGGFDRRESIRRAAKRLQREGRAIVETRTTVRRAEPPR